MKIYESDYLLIEHLIEKNMVKLEWSEKSENMSDEQYKQEMLKYAESLEKHHPKYVLIDTKSASFPISPDLQKWTNMHIISKAIDVGLQKTAVIYSTDFITQLSVEQVFDEDKQSVIRRQIFDNLKDAEEWLFETE